MEFSEDFPSKPPKVRVRRERDERDDWRWREGKRESRLNPLSPPFSSFSSS